MDNIQYKTATNTTVILYDEIDYKYNKDEIFEFNVTLELFLTVAKEYYLIIHFNNLNDNDVLILEKLYLTPILNISSPYFVDEGLPIKKIVVAKKYDLQWECFANPLDPII